MAPNILFIQTDEQVHSFLGCMGHAELRTPHIDGLAASGLLFTNAYAANGVCVPSRACLMTGRYPTAHGVSCNEHRLPASEITMGQLFGDSDYVTGYFGKTHYGRDDAEMAAEGWQQRFLWLAEYNAYLRAHGIDVSYPEGREIKRPEMRYWNVGTSRIPQEHYFEKVIADQAIDFIGRERGRPFLCYVSNVAPHGPFSPPQPYDTMYDPAALTLARRSAGELSDKPPEFVRWIRQNRKYVNDDELRLYLAHIYGLISLVDDQVGRLVAALRSAQIYDRTVIVFTADHGDFSSAYGVIGKSWCMDDRLMRVPLIISHPAARQPRRTAALTDNVDILPTLLEIAGIEAPSGLQGQSLLPLITGGQDQHKDAVFGYNEFPNDDGVLRQSMVRCGRWKLVQAASFKGELYDLAADPRETCNLIDRPEHRDLVVALRERLLRWHIDNSGGHYNVAGAGFWETRSHFYDETRFTG